MPKKIIKNADRDEIKILSAQKRKYKTLAKPSAHTHLSRFEYIKYI